MAITTAFPNTRKLEALQAICPSGSTYKMALYTSTAAMDKTTATYSTTNEVANGNGYTTGGIALTGYSATMSGDTAILDFADPVWATSSITARGAVVYDTTNANKVIAVLDFGADITSTNGNFTVTLPAPAAATALVRIG